jgi:aryl-alcohol dehydrogenase-like predicted oxidoreductase
VLDNLRSLGVDRLDAANLRLMSTDPEADFSEQLDAMIAIRDEGLIAGVGLSNVSRAQLLRAVRKTEIVCVQNPLSLLEREAMPVLRECEELGIAFVPYFPLGSAFGGANRLLSHPDVTSTAGRLAATPSQIALAWLLALAPNVLLIPGTSSPAHLRENVAASRLHLDDEALKVLDAITV